MSALSGWTPECAEGFDKLKLFISSEPVLRAPDYSRPFSLQIDAYGLDVGVFRGFKFGINFEEVRLLPSYRQHVVCIPTTTWWYSSIACRIKINASFVGIFYFNSTIFVVKHIEGVDKAISFNLSRQLPASMEDLADDLLVRKNYEGFRGEGATSAALPFASKSFTE